MSSLLVCQSTPAKAFLAANAIRATESSVGHNGALNETQRTRLLGGGAGRRASCLGRHSSAGGGQSMQPIQLQIEGIRSTPERHPRNSPPRNLGVRASASGSQSAPTKNLIGVHWLTWAGGLSEEECRKAIDGSAKLGYDLVEVPLGDPAAVDVARTRQIFKDANMAATASLGLFPEADVSSEDSEVAAAGEKLLAEAVDVAAGIGATIVTGITYSALHKYPSGPTAAGRRNSVAALKRIAARAADSGIQIGLEVVNRYESNLVNTAAQAMELLSEIDHPNVMVHLDSYHMNIEENSASEAVKACGDKLGYVHIGESHRGYLGTGSVDFAALFAALAAAQYQGAITFESFSSRVVNPQLSNTLCVWRNLWDDSEDLAKHAKAFIDEKWNNQ